MSMEGTNVESARWARLPAWLRPHGEDRGRERLTNQRLIETTLLVLIGLLLAIATVNDVVRQVHTNRRLIADLHTWRTVTGHDYQNLTAEQDQTGHTTREVVCGNIVPGAPDKRPQVCLIITGPTLRNLREARGGYYLAPEVIDLRRYRYGCFGTAAPAKLCGLAKPPAGATAPPLVKGG
jgi:cell division protein FtsL